MKLHGIYKNDQYIPATGIHNGIPYQIENHKDYFVLNRKVIQEGVGIMLSPVALFDNSWTGIYSETILIRPY